MKHTSDSDQGEDSGEEITDELVPVLHLLLNDMKKADQMGFKELRLREAVQR